jgi:hypothetical protein
MGVGHTPPPQALPLAQAAPSATQTLRWPGAPSQQPEPHRPPVQQTWPVPPQGLQVSPLQA